MKKIKVTLLAGLLALLGSIVPVRAEGPQFTQLAMDYTGEAYALEGIEITQAGHILKDLFRQNNDKILDWAIASSVEGVFYYGKFHDIPNTVAGLYFPGAAASVKNFNETTRSGWDSFFFGPAYTYLATEDEHVGWFKCGIKLWGNKGNK